jgi:hypothetical protein
MKGLDPVLLKHFSARHTSIEDRYVDLRADYRGRSVNALLLRPT